MDRDRIKNTLENAEFTDVQGETLSHILADQVTKEDLRLAVMDLENRILGVESRLENRILGVESRLENRILSLENSLENRILGVENSLENRILGVENSLENRTLALENNMLGMKSDLQASLHRLEANMLRWAITLLLAMAGLMTLFDVFID